LKHGQRRETAMKTIASRRSRAANRDWPRAEWPGTWTSESGENLMNTLQRCCIAALCGIIGQVCLAAEPVLPPTQKQGDVTFVTGGIGSDEAGALRVAAAQYNLRLTFAAVSGEFLAGVSVTLNDKLGRKVAHTVSDGPYLFFNVPAGTYRITADNMGQIVSRTAHVRATGATEVYLRWSTAAEQ
jgi:hypothetical protein